MSGQKCLFVHLLQNILIECTEKVRLPVPTGRNFPVLSNIINEPCLSIPLSALSHFNPLRRVCFEISCGTKHLSEFRRQSTPSEAR